MNECSDSGRDELAWEICLLFITICTYRVIISPSLFCVSRDRPDNVWLFEALAARALASHIKPVRAAPRGRLADAHRRQPVGHCVIHTYSISSVITCRRGQNTSGPHPSDAAYQFIWSNFQYILLLNYCTKLLYCTLHVTCSTALLCCTLQYYSIKSRSNS